VSVLTPSRRVVLVAAGVGALAAGVGLGLARRGGPAPEASVLDEFWAQELPTPGGAGLALRALRGRPLVINFWATWCPPCVKEMPELDRFARAFSGQGWQVLGVAIDQADPVRTFLKSTPVSFPIVLAGTEGLSWVRRLGNAAGGLPFSVAVSSQGVVTHQKLGATDFAELSSWAGKA
jgi:thiol-disulfide isomerase/thioredoxin